MNPEGVRQLSSKLSGSGEEMGIDTKNRENELTDVNQRLIEECLKAFQALQEPGVHRPHVSVPPGP